jgi:Rho-binding antiterminator
MTKPISCHLHDYIEIACLYGYRIKLELVNGGTLQGQAITIETENQREYLLIDVAGAQHRIETNQLKRMQALTHNPHFNHIQF